MIGVVKCFRKLQYKDGFSLSYIFEKDGDLREATDKSKVIPLTDFKFEEPFLLWDPEYVFSPVYDKRYPVILGDWNMNSYIFLQNIDKFSVVFLDEVGSSYLSGRVPSRVIGLPIFILYVDVIEREDIREVLKNKKIDILFVGNLSPGIHSKRNRLLKKILTLPEDYKVAVVSGLYDKRLYSEALSTSKIVFNYSVEKGMNMRVFETLKSGSCLFLEDENIQTWKYLKRFEDVVPYTYSNLIDLIQKYLSDDDAREKITVSGYGKIKAITKNSVYRRILEEIGKEDTFSPYKKSLQAEVVSFRSFVNDVFNFPVCINEKNLSYAESWCFSLMEKANEFTKSSLLSDFAFLCVISTMGKKNMLDKSLEYLSSALSFEPKSLIYWYNLAFLNYSMKNWKDFQISCKNFFSRLKDLPLEESMKHIRGFPEPFSPIIFSHYSIFKTYIDKVWIENFEDTEALRREISKILSAQIYVFLCNFALEMGDYKGAERFCLESLRLFQDLPSVYYTLGKTYMGMGRFQEAASVYLKAYSQEPFLFQNWPEVISSLYYSGDKHKLEEVVKEMNLISSRLYLYNGSKFDVDIVGTNFSFTLKSIQDFINGYISDQTSVY